MQEDNASNLLLFQEVKNKNLEILEDVLKIIKSYCKKIKIAIYVMLLQEDYNNNLEMLQEDIDNHLKLLKIDYNIKLVLLQGDGDNNH